MASNLLRHFDLREPPRDNSASETASASQSSGEPAARVTRPRHSPARLIFSTTVQRPDAVYRLIVFLVYSSGMDVTVTDLRAHLSSWLERASNGDDIVITDRGVPVARLTGLTTTATLERLTADGVIGRPATARRPQASGRTRPHAARPVADIVSGQRR